MKNAFRALMALVLMLAAMYAAAQAYPVKPVRITVTYPPGGSTDAIARILSPQLAERFGQPFVVENRPGGLAGGTIGADYVAKSPPDGYTLLVFGGGSLSLGVATAVKTPYDPVKSFAPITLLVKSPMIIAVNPSLLPVSSVKELVTMLKAKPGLAFASGGTASGMHLAGELFKLLSGVDILHVPYKGNGPALSDLMGGQVPIAFVDLGSAARFIKSGRLRVLALASTRSSVLAPEIPTAVDAGFSEWQSMGSFGLLAPAGTPQPIIQRLNAEVTALLRRPDIRDRILATGNEPAPTTPEEFANFIISEIPRWSKVVKDSGQKFD